MGTQDLLPQPLSSTKHSERRLRWEQTWVQSSPASRPGVFHRLRDKASLPVTTPPATHVIARALARWRGKCAGTMLSPDPPCSTHSGHAPEQQLGSRSLVFKSIKGDCYGDTTAASASGSARHPIWPSPPRHLLSSQPSKSGVCLEFMDTVTVFSTAACKRSMALESFTVP